MPIIKKNEDEIWQETNNDHKAKGIMRRYDNEVLKTKGKSLKVGDLVLLKNNKITKDCTTYECEPYMIIQLLGNQAKI